MDERDRYGVIGNPVMHSLSPAIHTVFIEQTQEPMVYGFLEAPVNRFKEVVHNFFLEDGKGLNVTLPFKEEAYAFADSHSPYANIAQAVNTLKLEDDGTISGHNTDGIGLVKDLCTNGSLDLSGQRLLILGAGGAVRGIIPALFEAGVAHITCANRTASRAQRLAQDLLASPDFRCGELEGLGMEEANDKVRYPADSFDGIINATSASLQGQLPDMMPEHLRPQWAYDLFYIVKQSATSMTTEPTAFMNWSSQYDILTSDGFGMLVEQAAESFKIWRGVRPDTSAASKSPT